MNRTVAAMAFMWVGTVSMASIVLVLAATGVIA